jgi:hypothetical protein
MYEVGINLLLCRYVRSFGRLAICPFPALCGRQRAAQLKSTVRDLVDGVTMKQRILLRCRSFSSASLELLNSSTNNHTQEDSQASQSAVDEESCADL